MAPIIRCRICLLATHRSLFDGSLQGVARTDCPAFSFQGHPEASPGPHDVAPLFDRFIDLIRSHAASGEAVAGSAAARN
jgi:carbamoyl-phosphate synthase small subunit